MKTEREKAIELACAELIRTRRLGEVTFLITTSLNLEGDTYISTLIEGNQELMCSVLYKQMTINPELNMFLRAFIQVVKEMDEMPAHPDCDCDRCREKRNSVNPNLN